MKKMIMVLLAALPVFNASALECDNAQTQSEMNNCATAAYKKADDELNKLYENIKERTRGKHKKMLKKTQQKWIEYRDSDCRFQTYLSRKNSIYPMVYAYCRENKTRERVNEFKKMLDCPEGDVSCPLSVN
ncbi:hypothetical protein REG_1819 [Candidatus Regiella insecticola LSR1]|uniref:Lysozyme inhibitor LprI-like N-terminal domain-containing protein n=1 Tax=Candidatus Regiella insecticola LSR1 TaxID=663321 RepID=E0WUN7_9ENTR|nr:lysozyme inhibitor LprI family protein [Candidatus Regiella insecticola]EFL91281.1 hypothetical protein REG_1819 [Candidatus Regiella insecticola LSR1]